MVRPACEVVSCSKEQSETISLHKIPLDEIKAKPWHEFLEIVNGPYLHWKKKQIMSICSLHFKKDSFKVGPRGKKLIASGRYPTLHNSVDFSDKIDSPSEIQVENIISLEPHPFVDIHKQCNQVIQAQIDCIRQLKEKLSLSRDEISKLKTTIHDLRRNELRALKERCKRQQTSSKRKTEEMTKLQLEVKRMKMECMLPEPKCPADDMLLEIMKRRHSPSNEPYSDKMKQFAFNCHFVSPKGYAHLRNFLPKLLPDPTNCNKWTKGITAEPGILKPSLSYIKESNANKTIYYGLAYDEMAIRHQVIFDGRKMIGGTAFGGLSEENSTGVAKSALFCLATEINGKKSFPLAYILTNGLKADVLADFIKHCVFSVENCGGHVLTLSFDGLPANLKAAEQLGACLQVNTPEFKHYIDSIIPGRRHFLMPDACHMLKLIRKVLCKWGTIYTSEGKEIRWEYLPKLNKLQEKEELHCGNKITPLHVNFEPKKMNVKLCVQALSNATATSIDFCRSIGIPGFEGSQTTTEFLRMCDATFDVLNTRPYGDGKNAALSKNNKHHWTFLINTAKIYFGGLQIRVGKKLRPLCESQQATFVKGLITCLSSVQDIMHSIEKGQNQLLYLPTYRLSQDPLEVFFGTLRRRLGCNDNPNVSQLAYSVRAVLCFKLSSAKNGNCVPQEELLDKIPQSCHTGLEETSADDFQVEEECEEMEDQVPFLHLSDFVENVVAYIADFTGKKIREKLGCSDCLAAIQCYDKEFMMMREDYALIHHKDNGGLFKPSEDLIVACRVVERIVRAEQRNGILSLSGERIEILVRRECLGRNLFSNLHMEFGSPSLKGAMLSTHITHKLTLINLIAKLYVKTRLHYVAKRTTFNLKLGSKRQTFHKIVHNCGG